MVVSFCLLVFSKLGSDCIYVEFVLKRRANRELFLSLFWVCSFSILLFLFVYIPCNSCFLYAWWNCYVISEY